MLSLNNHDYSHFCNVIDYITIICNKIMITDYFMITQKL